MTTQGPVLFFYILTRFKTFFNCNIFYMKHFTQIVFANNDASISWTFYQLGQSAAVPEDERTNLRRRFASRIDSRTHDQKSQASTADLRSNEEGQRSPSDWGSLTSSQRSATRVRFQSNRYGPIGGITPTKDFPQTMHYSSWLVRAGYR